MPGHRAEHPTSILKQDLHVALSPDAAALPFTTCASIHSTRVHFPPTPKLACRGLTYPSHAYDRAPIVVVRNTCALPSRNTREYHAPDAAASVHDEHTRARARFGTSTAPLPASNSYFAPDTLAWSSSSESDDSDASVSSPLPAEASYPPPPGLGALAFLPHGAPPPPSSSPPKERRRRSATPCRGARRAPSKPVATSFGAFADDAGCLGGF